MNKLKSSRIPAGCTCALLAAFIISLAHAASAGTVAHWRFEEGPEDTVVKYPQLDVIIDASGNENHLRTWSQRTTPTYVTNTPFDSVPQSGEPNEFSLDFGNGNRDIYSENRSLNTRAFEELTIEVSFKVNDLGRFQVILGKDGNPVVEGAPPVSLKVLDTGQLEFLIVDGEGEVREVRSEGTLQVGVWYTAAATANEEEISLWMKRSGGEQYEKQGTQEVEGIFPVVDNIWTIGRGMWNGEQSDFFNGAIDEIRISDSILEPFEFLGTPPDPEEGEGTLLELSQIESRGERFRAAMSNQNNQAF